MAKDKNAFEFPQGIDPSEYLEGLKKMAEDGLGKTKEAYEQAQAAFEQAQKEAEASMNTVQEHTSKISLAALEAVRSNTESSLSYMESLIGVKSIADVMEIQTSYARKQAEMATDTAKSMQALYQDAAQDVSAPAKDAADKAMKAFKGK
ncbi:MAG: phasin family protein [Pseudomonadota bacterium]